MGSWAAGGSDPMRTDLLVWVALALLVPACSRDDDSEVNQASESDVRKERVELRVDAAALSGDDVFVVIEPVYWGVNIYGSLQEYEASLKSFSRPQRLLVALHWYIAEVNNGGHDQFYSNSTGIVWPDALAAFEEIGVPDGAEIIRESARRLGGLPSRERDERNRQLEQLEPNFEDLDTRFYALQDHTHLDASMLEYARRQPTEFYFTGMVERPVLNQPPVQ